MAALNGQRTFAQIKAEIDSHVFIQSSNSTTTYPTTSMINNIVNKWYKRFVSKRKWLWLTAKGTVTASASTALLTMPDTVARVANLNIRSISANIPVYTRQSFLAEYPSGWNNTGEGIPIIAVENVPASNNAIQYELWPTPNANYTINYDGWLHVTPLSADGDYSIIPPEFEDVLVHGPVSEIFVMLKDERASYHQAEVDKIGERAFMQDEDMIMSINQMRGNDTMSGQPLVYPYHQY